MACQLRRLYGLAANYDFGTREASSQDEHEFDDTIANNLSSLLQTEATLLQDADRANVMSHNVSVERTICH
jgi:hypothetical protein